MSLVKSLLRVPVNKAASKWFILNLNNYRNTHYHVLNKAKQTYTEELNLDHLPSYIKIQVRLVVYAKNKRKFDLDNVCSIHAKFFLDSLVKANKIPDDSYDCVTRLVYEFGGICKDDPRVDIFIKGIPSA